MDLQNKRTSLYEEHKKLEAKMTSFAGWEMPLQYSSVKEEHLTVRTKVGIFDVSHMGQVFITGKNSLDFLQNLVPKDLSQIKEGKAIYSMLVKEDGGIIDDLIIYRLSSDNKEYKFMLIINASRIKEDLNRLLEKKHGYDVEIKNKSDELSMIAVQGPFSSRLIEKLGLIADEQPKRFRVKETNLLNTDVLIARTGYTGEDGFEIVINNENAVMFWQELMAKGQDLGLKPIGYAARDTLRIEASMLLYGQDMDENTTPVEAALCWAISKDKKEDYAGKQIILNQMLNKQVSKKLVGFKMLDKSIPRHDYEIYINNENAGKVTSGSISPCINAGIGLGYVDTKKSFIEGTKIDIMIRGKLHPAQIVKKPFYNRMSL